MFNAQTDYAVKAALRGAESGLAKPQSSYFAENGKYRSHLRVALQDLTTMLELRNVAMIKGGSMKAANF